MQFNGYSYLVLLIPVVALYWGLPTRVRAAYLLVLSLLFYACWKPLYLILPLTVCAVIYVCGQKIIAAPEAGKRRWMWGGVTFVVLTLCVFKYGQFFVDNVSAALVALGQAPLDVKLALALPLGISFYSFEAIGFLIDARQGRIKSFSPSESTLFLMFWPNIVSGPIARFREVVPQFRAKKAFEMSMLLRGLDRLIWGLVQKNLIANNIAAFVDEGFNSRAARLNSSLDNWMLAIGFGLQIYMDFAAYSNMAIGSAQLLGITLPENFKFPYHASNPSDFWTRWHMSLSRWIRDYLFFPINARFRGAPLPLYVSLVGIMALVGLWHGAGWGFVLWGVMHGTYLVMHRIWEQLQEKRFPTLATSRVTRWAWRIFTLLAVMAAWVPFRAATVGQALDMLRSMFLSLHFGHVYQANFYLVILSVGAFCAAEPYLVQGITRVEQALAKRQVTLAAHLYLLRPLLYAVGLFLFVVFDDRNAQFIYFQF
jgi:alginate O-acetyltransferase complex protein AlgI